MLPTGSSLSHSPFILPPLPLWKRALDIAGCILALPVFIVAALFVTVLLAVVSPGPILYRQERVGLMGRRFMLYKFRTMRVDADCTVHRAHFSALLSSNQPMQKLDAGSDHRLIAGGWLLRALGIDELPQLLNVFRGEMSLVGPRPCLPYEYEKYSAHQRTRFASVPGLTGLWQVSGKNRTTFEEMVRLDIAYSQVRSLALDLKILLLTLPALCRQLADTRLVRRTRTQPAANAPVTSQPPSELPNLKPSLSPRLRNSIAQ